ncbi:hypothetical protein BN159_3549 [Streptomyces davaonensis JCM 4913]|uniref:MoaD/ThiS family protein n=1 Tax=Streptomyces davaonensis (strain DSM 101723 / JCM 4913 / KCC S-0913 / 768) TaxID=1214101 RepID=K4R3L8_STRDJ|nr:hypothetical protein [Streptomyces davaonensis]CCK27928.1 hypothetical protein BN159_3549 [Streptomyces davaonensis JCM 4913]
MGQVTFVDETTMGERETGPRLDVAEERLTVRELIRRRMRREEDRRLALKAFTANGLIVLVGDRQVTDLDEEVDLTADTEVTFLRLIPLAGG